MPTNQWVQLLDWLWMRTGFPGVISVASLIGVGYMLRVCVRALQEVTTGNNVGLQQISDILSKQEASHARMMETQVQHTEVLRSLKEEVKSIGDNAYRAQAEAMRQLADLATQAIQRNSRAGV
jgi:hypothetical protein